MKLYITKYISYLIIFKAEEKKLKAAQEISENFEVSILF